MRNRYRMFRRGTVYYAKDRTDGKAVTLSTSDRNEARKLLHAKTEAVAQSHLNLAMARVYLSSKTPEMLERTWNDVMLDMEAAYHGPTLLRWRRQMKRAPFQSLRKLKLLETEGTHFLAVLRHPRAGTAAHKWLRIVHNRALDLGWVLAPVLARKLWPQLRTKKGKAITAEQHGRIVADEKDREWRLFLEMLWEIGGAQTDTARLRRENVDLLNRRLTYTRQKLENVGEGSAAIAIGDDLMKILEQLPKEGWLFPKLAHQTDAVRASRFRKRRKKLGFLGITLHSYRYAWAQRAKTFGMPLREAMAHLGHGSKAVHLAYSKQAEVISLPCNFTSSSGRRSCFSSKPHRRQVKTGRGVCALASGNVNSPMPVIFNMDLSKVETPLRDLLQFVPGVLEKAAPECQREFDELFSRLAWRFEANADEGVYGFAADTLEYPTRNVIYIPLAALERTWAYVYAYLTLFDVSRAHPGIEITRAYSKEVNDAFELLNWANVGEDSKERMEWPEELPRPDSKAVDPNRIAKTNEFFLGVLAFILLHEVAHIELGHTLVKKPLPEEKQRAECQADRWAEKWLLDRISEYSTDERFRINRCNWVMLALSILNLVEYNNRDGLPTGHPPTLERIMSFANEFCPESPEHVAPTSDFPIFLALTVIECQALNLGVGERLQTFDTMTDRLFDLHRRFERNYGGTS